MSRFCPKNGLKNSRWKLLLDSALTSAERILAGSESHGCQFFREPDIDCRTIQHIVIGHAVIKLSQVSAYISKLPDYSIQNFSCRFLVNRL